MRTFLKDLRVIARRGVTTDNRAYWTVRIQGIRLRAGASTLEDAVDRLLVALVRRRLLR